MNHLSRPRFITSLGLLVFAGTAPVAHAALLVYEGFDYALNARLDTLAPNSSTIGLNTGVTYYDAPSSVRTVAFTVQNGLSFARLQTTGGALAFGTGTNVIGADISATNFTGTLWSSYLVRLAASSNGSGSGNGVAIRVGDTPADSSDSSFTSWADSRSGTLQKLAVGHGAGATSVDGNNALAPDTTYIIINRFTRVGQAISVSTPGVATSWALTEAQYALFLDQSNGEAWLDSASGLSSVTSTAMHTNSTSSTRTFSSSRSTSIVTVGMAGTYDELRFGSTLADVTPTAVPEPASTSVIMGIGCGFLILCCRTSRRR